MAEQATSALEPEETEVEESGETKTIAAVRKRKAAKKKPAKRKAAKRKPAKRKVARRKKAAPAAAATSTPGASS